MLKTQTLRNSIIFNVYAIMQYGALFSFLLCVCNKCRVMLDVQHYWIATITVVCLWNQCDFKDHCNMMGCVKIREYSISDIAINRFLFTLGYFFDSRLFPVLNITVICSLFDRNVQVFGHLDQQVFLEINRTMSVTNYRANQSVFQVLCRTSGWK